MLTLYKLVYNTIYKLMGFYTININLCMHTHYIICLLFLKHNNNIWHDK